MKGEKLNPTHLKKLQRYAQYEHLREPLREISQPICEIAWRMAEKCKDAPDPAEVTRGLNALIEAKDCFVRAMLPDKEE